MPNIGTLIILAAVIAVIALAVRSIVKNKREGRSSCGCGCSECSLNDACHQRRKNDVRDTAVKK